MGGKMEEQNTSIPEEIKTKLLKEGREAGKCKMKEEVISKLIGLLQTNPWASESHSERFQAARGGWEAALERTIQEISKI